MKTTLLLFTILFCCALTVIAQKDYVAQEKILSDEYQVYRTVLKELFIKPTTEQLVIRNLTSGNLKPISKAAARHNLLALSEESLFVASETIDSYEAINQKPSKLNDEFDLEVPVVLLDEKEVVETLKKIQEQYPEDKVERKSREFLEQLYKGGFRITLSNIGFNKEKKQALLHIEYDCSGLYSCGTGKYVFLMKEIKGWTIKKQLLSWMS